MQVPVAIPQEVVRQVPVMTAPVTTAVQAAPVMTAPVMAAPIATSIPTTTMAAAPVSYGTSVVGGYGAPVVGGLVVMAQASSEPQPSFEQSVGKITAFRLELGLSPASWISLKNFGTFRVSDFS